MTETTDAAQAQEAVLAGLRRKIDNGRLSISIDDREYLFRVPGFRDLVALDCCIPLFGMEATDDQAGDGSRATRPFDLRLRELAKDPARAVEVVERAEAILRHLALRPRLVADDQIDLADDEAPLGAIPDMLKIGAASLLIASSEALSGAAFGVRPTFGDRSSSSSTSSPADTDASQVSSSSEPKVGTSPESSA